jgi:hypothetical protein
MIPVDIWRRIGLSHFWLLLLGSTIFMLVLDDRRFPFSFIKTSVVF